MLPRAPQLCHAMDSTNTAIFCSELRLKDIERVTKQFESVKALEKRGHSKEQKEEMVICQKVLDWLESGKDIRYTLGHLFITDRTIICSMVTRALGFHRASCTTSSCCCYCWTLSDCHAHRSVCCDCQGMAFNLM